MDIGTQLSCWSRALELRKHYVRNSSESTMQALKRSARRSLGLGAETALCSINLHLLTREQQSELSATLAFNFYCIASTTLITKQVEQLANFLRTNLNWPLLGLLLQAEFPLCDTAPKISYQALFQSLDSDIDESEKVLILKHLISCDRVDILQDFMSTIEPNERMSNDLVPSLAIEFNAQAIINSLMIMKWLDPTQLALASIKINNFALARELLA